MTADEGERLIAAAKASVKAAQELGLPVNDPDSGVAYDAKRSIERIEKAVSKGTEANLALHDAVITYSARLTKLFRLTIGLAVVFVLIVGFFLARTSSLANDTVDANRRGCAGLNVIRDNQGRALQDQIRQTEASLKRDLGPLEQFREQVEDGLVLRKDAVRKLRRSVLKYPVKGQPFHVNCKTAFP